MKSASTLAIIVVVMLALLVMNFVTITRQAAQASRREQTILILNSDRLSALAKVESQVSELAALRAQAKADESAMMGAIDAMMAGKAALEDCAKLKAALAAKEEETR